MKNTVLRGLSCRVALVLSMGACSASVEVTTGAMSRTDGSAVLPDAGSSADGGMCVDFGRPSFDTSCAGDGDCASVFAGTLCPGYNCVCPAGRSINARELPRYQSLGASVPRGAGPFCSCPALGRSSCVAGQCVWCSNFAAPGENPAGCRDGG